MSDDQVGNICVAVVVIMLLACLTKCSVEEDRLNWEKEKYKMEQKP